MTRVGQESSARPDDQPVDADLGIRGLVTAAPSDHAARAARVDVVEAHGAVAVLTDADQLHVIVRRLPPAPGLGVAVSGSRVLVGMGGALGGAQGEGRAGARPGHGLGLNAAVIPTGKPVTVKETSPFDPLMRFMSTGTSTDVPSGRRPRSGPD